MVDEKLLYILLAMITALSGYVVKLHLSSDKEKREFHKERSAEIKMMSEALTSTKSAIENNTRVMERLPDAIFDKIHRATKK